MSLYTIKNKLFIYIIYFFWEFKQYINKKIIIKEILKMKKKFKYKMTKIIHLLI